MSRRELVKETGQRLSKVRKRLKYSQERMGAFFGIGRSSYTKYEYGKVFPGPAALESLANTYDISLDWLIAGKGPEYYKEKEQPQPVEEKEAPAVSSLAPLLPDIKELLEQMEHIPLLRYEVLAFFHRFKLENRELIGTSTAAQEMKEHTVEKEESDGK